MIGIFSGRFDPPHVGHILTVLRLFNQAEQPVHISKVLVVVLEYPEREACTAEKAKQIFDTILYGKSVSTVICPFHFARITLPQYHTLLIRNDIDPDNAVYFSGNMEVIKHFNEMKENHYYIERSETYSGTDTREMIRSGKDGKVQD